MYIYHLCESLHWKWIVCSGRRLELHGYRAVSGAAMLISLLEYRQMPTNTKLKRLVHHQVRLHLLRYRSNIRRAEFKLYTRKIGKSRS